MSSRTDPIEESMKYRSSERKKSEKPENHDLEPCLGEKSPPLPQVKGKFYTNFLKELDGRKNKFEDLDPSSEVLSHRRPISLTINKISAEEAKGQEFVVIEKKQKNSIVKEYRNYIEGSKS